MIIQRLDLLAFGRFTNVSLDLSAGPRRFHIVYGPNESGKSTSLRAITSLLFGMEHRTNDNYLHNNAQMRVGGVLADDNSTITCVRRRGRKATLRDGSDDQVIDESIVNSMLGGIDRETFLTRFGLSHQELVQGGAAILAGQGDLGEILFSAGAGVSQLRNIQTELEGDRDRLFLARGTRVINTALKDLDEQRKGLREAQIQPTEFMDLRDRLQRKQSEADELDKQVSIATVELAKWRAFEQALPLLPEQRSLIQSLASLGSVRGLDEDFSHRRREAQTQREMAQKVQQETTNRVADLKRQLESMPVDETVLVHEPEIESIFQELAARDKADRDRVELARVQRNVDRKISDLLRELSVTLDSDDDQQAMDDVVDRLRVSDALRTRVNELSAKYERLVQQRDDSDDQLKTLKRKLTDVNSDLSDLGEPIDPTALSAVIDDVGSPITLLNSLTEQRNVCKRLTQQAEQSLQNLDGFDGNVRQAAQLQTPAHTSIHNLTKKLEAADKSIVESKSQLAALHQQREQLSRQLSNQRKSAPLPTLKQLDEARQKRDKTIALLIDPENKQSTTLLQQLEEQVQTADTIVDTIRQHHEEIHRRELDQQRLTETDRQIAAKETDLESLVHQLQNVQEDWMSLWAEFGIAASAPARMIAWVAEHEKLKALFEQLESEESRLQQFDTRLARATSRLRSALDTVSAPNSIRGGSSFTQADLFSSEPTTDLDSLYDEAVALRTESQNKRTRYDALRRKRDELSEELPAVETRFETRQRAVDQWQEDWQRVTASFTESGESTPSVVMSTIRRIDELCEKKRERDILASRIRSILQDGESYAARVRRVASAMDMKTKDDAETGAIVRAMYGRLQAERAAAGQRTTIHRELSQASEQTAAAKQRQEQNEIILQQLCKEAGVPNSDDLPDHERRSRQYTQFQASLRDIENQLALLAGDEGIEDFVQEASQQKPALISEHIQQKQLSLTQVRDQLASVQREIGSLQHKIDDISGGARASELHQSIQMLVGKIESDAEEYGRLKVATLIMRRAIEHYRKENQSPVLAEAERMFSQLTCGEYESLKVDYDTKGKSILFGVRPSKADNDLPTEVPVPSMSVGTADALYLSLRLASLGHQLTHGVAVPVVIDDCLVQLDDARAIAAMKILSRLSESTQVILFTHHQHLLDLASQHLNSGELHVHHL